MKILKLVVSDEFFDSLIKFKDSTVSFSEGRMDNIRYDKEANEDVAYADAIFRTSFVYPKYATSIRDVIEECDRRYIKVKDNNK
jgi:hypothetical protein